MDPRSIGAFYTVKCTHGASRNCRRPWLHFGTFCLQNVSIIGAFCCAKCTHASFGRLWESHHKNSRFAFCKSLLKNTKCTVPFSKPYKLQKLLVLVRYKRIFCKIKKRGCKKSQENKILI